MKRYCYTLDLKNDPQLIEAYERYHLEVWPEVINGIVEAGIVQMEIFRFDTRMFMIMDTTDEFSFEQKAILDKANEVNTKWEALMWNFQAPVPGAPEGQRWVMMKEVFNLNDQLQKLKK